MSDPNDPYRFTDIGGGINPFGESISNLREEFEKITEIDIVAEFKKIREEFDKLTKKMGEGSKPIETMTKELSDRKVQRGVKEATKMTKSFKETAPAFYNIASSIGPMSIALKVLSTVLNALKPLIDMVNMLFTALGAGITKALIPVFQKFADMMPDLIPIFIDIGTLIGEVIAVALVPLLDIFKLIMPVILEIAQMILPVIADLLEGLMPIISDIIEAILPVLLDVFELFEPILEPLVDILLMFIEVGLVPLKVILDIIKPILQALNPLFEALGVILEDMGPVIDIVGQVLTWIIKIGFVPLVSAIYAVGLVIAGIIDFFTAAGKKNQKAWKATMEPILKSLIEVPEWGALEEPETGGSEDKSLIKSTVEEIKEKEKEELAKVGIPTKMAEEETTGLGGTTATPSLTEAEQIEVLKEAEIPTKIAGLQGGAIVLSEGIFRLGEKNKPEIVQPLEPWERAQKEQTLLLENIYGEISQLTEYNRRLLSEKEFKYKFEIK